MEEDSDFNILDGEIREIKFGLASYEDICVASNSDFAIGHASQLTNPFLGLPLETGRCESCGTAEPGKCDGHFGFIEFPIPIYHPSHVSELRRMLSLLCLKCLRMKTNRFLIKSNGGSEKGLNSSGSCCEELSQISVKEVKTTEGAYYLELKFPGKSGARPGFWNFLERYGFRYGEALSRPLLPSEVMEILKKIPSDTRKRLARKGYFPQEGYILQFLPVPPNCLSVPDISDGTVIMSSDPSRTMLKKVLRQIDIIKSSRSGLPNFESLEVEANDLQSTVAQYLDVRGTAKASRDVDRFGVTKELNDDTSTKAWLEKMRTLFIRKGSGFSSRSVITGDAYRGVDQIGIPVEIAQRITFEEKVNVHNREYLQRLVDDKLCLAYRDGLSTFSLREGSSGHTVVRPGQVVHRRIMDGDILFINRPPTTHKHSLQAFSVYVHADHTVKINPLICGPLSADFDGDCVHLFYPQSLAAKAEVLELFLVEKQLLSSHSGNFNLQMATDSLLSLKNMFRCFFLDKAAAQQLSMFVSTPLPAPALLKGNVVGPFWTALQILQTALPLGINCHGEKYIIRKGELLKGDLDRDGMQSMIDEIVTSVLFEKGPKDVLNFFNSLQPLLMEFINSEGFSVGLEDFSTPSTVLRKTQDDIKDMYTLLYNLNLQYNELVEMQLENHIRQMNAPYARFILKSSALGTLIDSKRDSAANKVVQQIGFLGLQLSDRGKFYTKTLVKDMASLFKMKCSFDEAEYPTAEFGLIRSCFFHGLNPFEEMVHSISSREVLVRSSRGLSEPGTLFKNLMAILRDVVVCYDGTVRNVCSNSIIQFKYGPQSLYPAGEPVGVLAATAMSNPAYKAVLDSSPSSNSSWDYMKEILLCRVNYKNDLIDRRIILYLNECGCGRSYCQENAAYMVMDNLKKVSLKDVAVDFMIEYKNKSAELESSEPETGLIGHIHLNKIMLTNMNIGMPEILQKCQEVMNSCGKKKKNSNLKWKSENLFVSDCCEFRRSYESQGSEFPCLRFHLPDKTDTFLEKLSGELSDVICPIILETVIKGDPRINSVNITWISPDSTSWIRSPCRTGNGELALDVVLDKAFVKQSGDAWRVMMDACLPFVHLIDTRRSVPYAIKQVEELLGIACAFDQAVQRLSTSVSMVAKGVRKEHLMLLANSMTAGGSLIGFNIGGYKALSRSLDIQVPFTEATLYTPKKCFERAAEKCHADPLSSIVGSCSWGKHVVVGTGSRFDLLWNTEGLNNFKREGGVDVHSFLHLVQDGGARGSETGCLGAEVDDLEEDDFDLGLSPEHGFEKPTFEEIPDIQMWDSKEEAAGANNSDNWGDGSWEKANRESSATQDQPTNNWGQGSKNNESSPWVKANKESTATPEQSLNIWGQGSKNNGSSPWVNANKDSAPMQEQPSNNWGQGSKNNGPSPWVKANKDSAPMQEQTTNNWGQGSKNNESSPWVKANKESTATPEQSSNIWGQGSKKNGSSPWVNANKDSAPMQEQPSNNWGQGSINNGSSPWEKANKESTGIQEQPSNHWGQGSRSSPWEKANKESTGTQEQPSNHWGQGSINNGLSPWEKANKESTGTQEQPSNHWGHGSKNNGSSPWEKTNKESTATQEQPSNDWGQGLKNSGPSPWEKASAEAEQGKLDPLSEGQSQWDQQSKRTEGFGKWGEQGESRKGPVDRVKGWNTNSGQSGWSQQLEGSKQNGNSPNWGGQTNTPNELSQLESLHGCDSPITGGKSEDGMASQWGQKNNWSLKRNSSENSRGWGSSTSGEWKNKTHPVKSPRTPNDGATRTGILTATRQRLDMFTSEEQEILSTVEPIMHSLRRIMRYNDGDPVSAEDQTYVLDNVFNYHPDKDKKMGAGIDYIMVNKHTTFQDTRCLFVVTKDGHKEDFSYRKCVQNLVTEKFPDLAEEFIGKYFSVRRPGGNRQSQPHELQSPVA